MRRQVQAAGGQPPVAIAGVLTPERVRILRARRKDQALHELIDAISTAPQITDRQELTEAVIRREALMSTGIGLGIAVPHVRLPSVTELVMAAGLAREGLADYESLDRQPVRLVFLIAARHDQHVEYLRLLSLVSGRLKDEALRAELIGAADAAAFHGLLAG